MTAAPTLSESEPLPSRSTRLYRHRSDLARLVFNLVLLGAFVLLAELAPRGLRSIAVDTLELVDGLPRSLVEGLVGVVQLTAVVVPVVAVVALAWRRRFALLMILGAAALISSVLMGLLADAVRETIPVDNIDFERFSSWFISGEFPSSTYLSAATSVLVAASPWLLKKWRRAGWLFIAAVTVVRLLTATEVPIRIGMLLTVGAACGSLALMIVGGPRRRVDATSVAGTLVRSGLDVTEVVDAGDDGGIPTFVAHGPNRSYFVKVVGRDERDGDLLLATWRRLTLRGLGDDVATGSPARLVAREALAMGMFASASVNVAVPIAVARTEDETSVLVMSMAHGNRVADVPPDRVTDAMLDAIWQQVARLQHRRLAHRRLNTEHLLVGDRGRVTIVDPRHADLEASDERLGAEVAELLASLAAIVGIGRSVRSAARSLSRAQLARAVPLVQPAVLTTTTMRALGGDKQTVTDLRNRLAAAAGIDEVHLAPVSRITVKSAVSVVGSLVLGAYLISLATNWDDIWISFQDANLAYALPVLVLALGTQFTGALSLLGAVDVPLSYLRTTAVMFGQSFLNRFTPANAGGMAMRIRYLQLNGQDTTVAAASVGLTSLASGVTQVILIVVFFIWGGATDRFSDFRFPDVGGPLLVVVVLGLVFGVIAYRRWGRERVEPWIRGTGAKLRSTFGELARDPSKMAMLFGGAAFGKLLNIIAFWMSTLAFGVDISFPKAGALFMIANTVGSAVPTPGGVGGIEAALTAVLIGFGVEGATAGAIVIFFRTLTFWVPTIPGYGLLQYTQRTGIV